MSRRDRFPLVTPHANESFEGWAIEPVLEINIADRSIKGHYRFYGVASRKFQASVPFKVTVSDLKMDNLVDAIAQKLINQDPTLAGTRITEEVTDPADPVP